MTVAAPTRNVASAESAAAPTAARGPVTAIFALAVAWCLILAALVVIAANPVVVNPLQIRQAEAVVQGTWIPGKATEVDVQRVWKGDLPLGRIAVSGQLREQSLSGEVIVPISRDRTGRWIVTGGVLANPPRDPTKGVIPMPAEVRPVVYPATDAVQQQLRDLLGEPPAGQ